MHELLIVLIGISFFILALLLLAFGFKYKSKIQEKLSRHTSYISNKVSEIYDAFVVRFLHTKNNASETEQAAQDHKVDNRIVGLATVVSAAFVALFARLWGMQLVSQDEYEKQAEKNRSRTIRVPAPRGRILDCNGRELVTNKPSISVMASNAFIANDIESSLLSSLLGIPVQALVRRAQDQTQGLQELHAIAYDISQEHMAYIEAHQYLFPDISLETHTQRYYPYGSLAAQTLGYVGPITKDQLEAKKEDKNNHIDYQLGDIVGQSGIELQYEEVLQGVAGEQNVHIDAQGMITKKTTNVEPIPGQDIVLALDIDVQKATEEALYNKLTEAQKAGHTKTKAGSAIVIDPQTGAVKAMASAPSFEPATFTNGISATDWDYLNSSESAYPLMNRAVSGNYVPASTIKPLSALAALNYGIATPQSTYNCQGYWTGFGKSFGMWCNNHAGHGIQNISQGISNSCNIVFYEMAKGFSNSSHKDGFQETYRAWGLGQKTDIDLPTESSGCIPDAQWKEKHYSYASQEDRAWKPGDYANIAIGQGDMQVTPIQLACIYAGFANNGSMYQPYLVKDILQHGTSVVIFKHTPELRHKIDIKSEYLKVIKNGLYGVIYDNASNTKPLASIPQKVLGKTGSGEHASGKTCLFCCIVSNDKYATQADDHSYAMSFIVEDANGLYPGPLLCPVAAQTISALYAKQDTNSTSE